MHHGPLTCRLYRIGAPLIYAWPVLLRKALRTLRETRNPAAMLFAWGSNLNYRAVAAGHQVADHPLRCTNT